jgi:aconitate hydratase
MVVNATKVGQMIDVRQHLELPAGGSRTYFSLPLLERSGVARLSRLPVSIRVLLESVLRHLDGRRIRDEDALALATWQPGAPRLAEVPFVVGRVLLQDFTGVPLLVDLAAMRSAVARRNRDLRAVQPHVPVDLVIDHSVRSTISAGRTRSVSISRWSSTGMPSAIGS